MGPRLFRVVMHMHTFMEQWFGKWAIVLCLGGEYFTVAEFSTKEAAHTFMAGGIVRP